MISIHGRYVYVVRTQNDTTGPQIFFLLFSDIELRLFLSLLWPKCVFYQHHMHKNVTDCSCVVVDPKVVSSYVTLQEQSKTKISSKRF